MSSTVRNLERFHAGDANALEAILAENRDWLWSYVRRQMGDHLRRFETSEDVVQETLRALIARGPAFLPRSDEEFRRLVATLALNRLRDLNDFAHAARRDPGFEASNGAGRVSRIGASESPSQLAMRREESDFLSLALELLDPIDARVIRQRTWHRASYAEIGAELGISAGAAQKRVVRATTRLGALIQGLETGDLSFLPPDPLADE